MPSFTSIFSTSKRTLVYLSLLTAFCISAVSIYIGIQLNPRALRDNRQQDGKIEEFLQADLQNPEKMQKLVQVYEGIINTHKRAQEFLTSALFYEGIILLVVPLFLIIYLTSEKNKT